MMDFDSARIKMVDNQIRTSDVTSHSVLSAFLTVPREQFVAEDRAALAYIDADLAAAPGRFTMAPAALAKLLQLAAISREDRVLEIGTGSGYGAALLSLLADNVTTVESDAALAAEAASRLAALGSPATVVTGALPAGHAAGAPYDVIFVAGAVEVIPPALLAQLAEFGKLIAVVGHGNASRATVVTRERGITSEASFFNLAVKPLPGFEKAREFVF